MSKIPGYPYFETKLWTGRLPVPLKVRGSVIAKQFERGTIGGKRIERIERYEDTEEGRRQLQLAVRRHQSDQFDVEFIVSPHRHRILVKSHIVLQPSFVAEGVPQYLLR